MILPRRVWDAKQAECDWLRSQLKAALDHNRRLERVEAGLPERRPPERKRSTEVLPEDIAGYVAGFATPALRDQAEKEIRAARGRGMDWDTIREELAG